MNIFILDNDIEKSAKHLNDKHIVKMLLEHCQMLCAQFPKGEAPYRKTHYNHPCSVWTRASVKNYEWLISYTREMFKEYSKRYGRIHKSEQVLDWCEKNYKSLDLPNIEMTPFAQAMPDKYKDSDPVKAYRNYYMGDKRHIAKWKTQVPDWWI